MGSSFSHWIIATSWGNFWSLHTQAGSRQDPPSPRCPFSVLFPTPSGNVGSKERFQHRCSSLISRSPTSALSASPSNTSLPEHGDETLWIPTCLLQDRLTKGLGQKGVVGQTVCPELGGDSGTPLGQHQCGFGSPRCLPDLLPKPQAEEQHLLLCPINQTLRFFPSLSCFFKAALRTQQVILSFSRLNKLSFNLSWPFARFITPAAAFQTHSMPASLSREE